MSVDWVRMHRTSGAKYICEASMGCSKGASAVAGVHSNDLPVTSKEKDGRKGGR